MSVKVPDYLNYAHVNYLNLFIICEQCNKIITKTCDAFAARYPEK